MEKLMRIASENSVVVFSKSTCCMCYTIKILFAGLDVTPLMYDIDLDPDCRELERALRGPGSNAQAVPTVYIGGQLVGSADNVISLHLNGKLKQMLRNYH